MKSPVSWPFAVSDWRAWVGFALVVLVVLYAVKYAPLPSKYKP